MFPELAIPMSKLKISKSKGQYYVFDIWRKKEVILTPEEWIRQHFLHHLVVHFGFPSERIAVEKQISINGLKRRFDALVYDLNGKPCVLIEFKEASVHLSEETAYQTAQYNHNLQVPWIILSNGFKHITISIRDSAEIKTHLDWIPRYQELFEN